VIHFGAGWASAEDKPTRKMVAISGRNTIELDCLGITRFS
jgi:hypothetical protein